VSLSFEDWRDEIAASKNQPAVVRRLFVALYPKHVPPEFGYIGKVANKVGGNTLLAKALWELSTRPPVDDVLAYIMQTHENGKRRGPAARGRASPDDVPVDAFYAAAMKQGGET
jgi:hypothetical protein